MTGALDRFFKMSGHNTKISIEILAGMTTFATMSYIIMLQPLILSGKLFNINTGMDFGALFTGACLASALGCFLMGLIANYPVALAPGMGENFFFTLSVLPLCASVLGVAQGDAGAWKLALGCVFVSGLIFFAVSVFGVRTVIMRSISPSLKAAISAGIGIFIAFIGLKNSGVIVIADGNISLVREFGTKPIIIFFIGLFIMSALHVLKVRGGILWGILAAAAVAALMGLVKPAFPFSAPPDVSPVFAKADVSGVIANIGALLPIILVFAFMDIFDTLGTLIGVGAQAGLMKDGNLPNPEKAFASDAAATVAGSLFGHSTVTSFIESAAGVESGGRTGLTAVVTGICFLLALFLAPLVEMVSSCNSVTAPALVVVGAMMTRNVSKIDWEDFSEAIPAFITLLCIPLSYSIADGITLGLVSCAALKIFSGKLKDLSWFTMALALILALYMLFIRR